jgi:RNA polymerase sigma-70 factor (ECF subfamily)
MPVLDRATAACHPAKVADDAELLQAWQDGDIRAGEQLFDRHFRALTRFFRNKVGAAEAEELISRTFVALLEGIDRFRGESTFRTYQFGVATNVLRNYFRTRATQPKLDLTSTTIHDLAPRPSQVLAERREHQLLVEGLRRIPFEHQVVLELFYWESLSASKIGEALAEPEGTIRSRLRRARALLRDAIVSLSADTSAPAPDEIDAWAADVRELVDRGS